MIFGIIIVIIVVAIILLAKFATDEKKKVNSECGMDIQQSSTEKSSVSSSQPVSTMNFTQNVKLHELYLPTFKDMDSPLTEDDIVSAIALTHTFLTLTYLNPFPFEQDPVFHGLYKVNCELFKNSQTSIDYNHCEDKWRERYNEEKVKLLIEMGYENSKVLWHYHQLKNSNMMLALKPAFKIVDYARHLNNNYIVIRYCYCLLKDKTGFLGDSQISDLLMALGANSLAIVFDEGLLYLKSRMSEIKLK